MLAILTGLMVLAGAVLAVMAGMVARRRQVSAGASLAVLLTAVSWWGFTYAIELSVDDLGTKLFWGDLKFAGIAVVGPAWLLFVLQYTGRERMVSRRLVALLAIEPVAVMVALLTPALHDLVRYYPPSAAAEAHPVTASGPLFWVHFTYLNLLLLVATSIFVVSMVRLSRIYRRLSAVLVAAALLPWVLNALHNLRVGSFAGLDLTPFAFIATGAVLFWGLFLERLVPLTPVARSMVVETMSDAVLVLDAFSRLVDVNPAGARMLGRSRSQLVGSRLEDVLPGHPWDAARAEGSDGDPSAETQLTLQVGGEPRHYGARRQVLPDTSGGAAGELVVLRDVTERTAAEARLRELLAERTRVAAALQASLLPTRLPGIPGVTVAGRYRPAGDGHEIGGDFFDVFELGPATWGIALGDVSGKGAEAAAVTGQIRYTLRTLAGLHRRPSDVLAELNDVLLRDGSLERYCTMVYAVARTTGEGLRLTVCLGGHHPPLLVREGGTPQPVCRTGTALGLLPAPALHDTEIELGVGDLLCLFTDGLVEARRGGDLFGEDRAAAVLGAQSHRSPAEAAEALESAARDFAGGRLGDDLALLLLRVDGVRTAPPAPTSTAASH